MARLKKMIEDQENLFVKDIREAKTILKNINWNFYQRIEDIIGILLHLFQRSHLH
jgi:hypothetical protein